MQAELAKLRDEATSQTKGSSSSYKTPPPRHPAPSPSPKPKSKSLRQEPGPPPPCPKGVDGAETGAEIPPAPQTEGAKHARLRRLCEVKPSGKCAVPKEVHERWKKADKAERDAMVEEFEQANWAKDSVSLFAKSWL